MQPGQGLICRECVHHLAKLWRQGHVAPCELVGWHDTKHHSPAIADDGRSCGGLLQRLEFVVDGELANGAATSSPIRDKVA